MATEVLYLRIETQLKTQLAREARQNFRSVAKQLEYILSNHFDITSDEIPNPSSND